MNNADIIFFLFPFLYYLWTAAALNPLPDFCQDRPDKNRFELSGNSMNISSPIFKISQ